MASNKVNEKIEVKVEIQVSREFQEGRYSNYASIGHSEDAFHILFGQTTPPRKVPADKTIVAQAVAHIIVPPAVMPKFIKAFSENYERYKKTLLRTNQTKREKKNERDQG